MGGKHSIDYYSINKDTILTSSAHSRIYTGHAKSDKTSILIFKCMNLDNFEDFHDKNFLKSTDHLLKLEEDNILKIYDTILIEKEFILVLPKSDEGSLEQIIHEKWLSNCFYKEEEFLDIFMQILKGYKYLYDQHKIVKYYQIW